MSYFYSVYWKRKFAECVTETFLFVYQIFNFPGTFSLFGWWVPNYFWFIFSSFTIFDEMSFWFEVHKFPKSLPFLFHSQAYFSKRTIDFFFVYHFKLPFVFVVSTVQSWHTSVSFLLIFWLFLNFFTIQERLPFQVFSPFGKETHFIFIAMFSTL